MTALNKPLLIIFTACFIIFTACSNQANSDKNKNENEYKTTTFKGEIEITEDLIIPEGELLIIEPGTILKISDKVSLLIEGRILANGTKENPVIFEGDKEGTYWRGIKITGLNDPPEGDRFWNWIENGDKATEDEFFGFIDQGHVFEHCIFRNLATDSRSFERKNKWKGSIEAYNTSLRVSNCRFEDILHFGAVLSQRSYVVANDNLFDDITMHKALNSTDRSVGLFFNNTITGHRSCNARCADGIWTKNFVGLIAANTVTDVADDGIDTDNSRVVIFQNNVNGVFDDGIDIDNGGLCYIIDNVIEKVNENGILISDGSEAILIRNNISESPYGLALRDGSEAVSEGLQITDNGHGIIIYQNIPVAISGVDYSRIREEISGLTVDEIFEAEYIDGTEGPEDLLALLDKYYVQKDDYWMFNKDKFSEIKKLDPLKKTFKIVGTYDLETISNAEIRLHPLAAALKNGLFLSGAQVKNNESDVSLYHDYNLKIESTEFTSEEIAKEINDNCKCDENHKCEIIDKINTSGVEINAKKIIKRIQQTTANNQG